MKLSNETWNFISVYASCNPAELRLRFAGKSVQNVDLDFALTQIEARKKAASKLADILKKCPKFIFPDSLSAEQCTAAPVAEYHKNILGNHNDVLDLTCGLGIDSLALASVSKHLTTCDIDAHHLDCFMHNAALLGHNNVTAIHQDATHYLHELPKDKRFSLIFADPARRSKTGNRTFALEDCSPDILQILPAIKMHTDRLVLKVSPMLDVDMLLRQLPDTISMAAISLKGECKELLVEAHFSENKNPYSFSAVNISAVGEISEFKFRIDEECAATNMIESDDEVYEGAYLFEPNASLMKFINKAPLAKHFPGIKKLGVNTNLYLLPEYKPNMPGRVLQIDKIIAPTKKIKNSLPEHINIVTRNYPLTPEQIKTKYKLKDGGTKFLYACRLLDRTPRFLLCKPL